MQYMLLIHSCEGDWQKLPEADQKSIYQEYLDITSELRDQGKFVHASQLQSTSAATRRTDEQLARIGTRLLPLPYGTTRQARPAQR